MSDVEDTPVEVAEAEEVEVSGDAASKGKLILTLRSLNSHTNSVWVLGISVQRIL